MTKKSKHRAMASGAGKCPIDAEYTGPLVRHHINGRKVKDWDADWNIAYVSPNTHQLIHEGQLIIEGWFMTSDGRELIWHWKNQESITGKNAIPHIIERS
jgi:hypothetical protein